MDLKGYDLKDLLLVAIKSEIESKKVYETLAKRVENFVLRDRLEFLAKEEEKHRKYLEDIYRMSFGDNIELPEVNIVPLPDVDVGDESRPLSQIIEEAMAAEEAARDFYKSLADFMEGKEKSMLLILANMEQGHYDLLATELENLRVMEDYDQYWPMMNLGP